MMRGALFAIGSSLLIALTSCSEPKQAASAFTNAQIEGKLLYLDHCADCHEKSNPDLLKQPPNLHGLFLRKTLPSGAPATDAQVRKTIIEGRGTMPAFDQGVSEEEVGAVVGYVHELK